MLVIDLAERPRFLAGDHTLVRELLHPTRHDVPLRYSIAHASLPEGEKSLPHRLAGSEVYFILEGRGRMHIDGEASEVGRGHLVYVPPGATQFIENTGAGELTFLCMVDPPWRAEDEEVD